MVRRSLGADERDVCGGGAASASNGNIGRHAMAWCLYWVRTVIYRVVGAQSGEQRTKGGIMAMYLTYCVEAVDVFFT